MKKTYQSPQLEIIMLNAKTSICTASAVKVGGEDESGPSQLSQQYWGTTIFDDTESSTDE